MYYLCLTHHLNLRQEGTWQWESRHRARHMASLAAELLKPMVTGSTGLGVNVMSRDHVCVVFQFSSSSQVLWFHGKPYYEQTKVELFTQNNTKLQQQDLKRTKSRIQLRQQTQPAHTDVPLVSLSQVTTEYMPFIRRICRIERQRKQHQQSRSRRGFTHHLVTTNLTHSQDMLRAIEALSWPMAWGE